MEIYKSTTFLTKLNIKIDYSVLNVPVELQAPPAPNRVCPLCCHAPALRNTVSYRVVDFPTNFLHNSSGTTTPVRPPETPWPPER